MKEMMKELMRRAARHEAIPAPEEEEPPAWELHGDNTDFLATLLKEYRLVTSTLFRQPGSLTTAITLAIYGYHFRKLVEGHCRSTT